MELTVAIYERREGSSTQWWTLGLGERNCYEDTADVGFAVKPGDVLRLVSERTGIPWTLLEPTETLEAEAVESRLEASVVGQPAGIAAVRDLVLREAAS